MQASICNSFSRTEVYGAHKLDHCSDDSTIFDENLFLCILASGRTLAVMLSPPVFSLSVASNPRPLRGATRPWGLPALKISDKCQLTKDNLCVAACLRLARACISLKIPFLSRRPSRLVFVEIQWTATFYQHVLLFGHSPFGSHVLFSEDSLTVFVFTIFIPTGSDVTESSVFVASAKDAHICSCKAV